MAAARAQFGAICAKLQRNIGSSKGRLRRLYNQSNPTTRIPNEILPWMMELACFEPFSVAERCLGIRCVRVEVLLLHVCQRWRGVAISTPALWTEICGPESPEQKKTARVEAYLSRSKGLLLDVSLIGTLDRWGSPRQEWGQDFLRAAALHSERWRSFFLCLPPQYDNEHFPGEDTLGDLFTDVLENVSVPHLETVELSIDWPSMAVNASGKCGETGKTL